MTTVRNHITLIGNMGAKAQITKFENGKRIARFSLATDNMYRGNNGVFRRDIEWHRLFAWGNLAEFIEKYGDKGKKVAVHGRLVNRTFLNQQGVKKNITEVEIRQIIGL
jgi:single-strand DNA-binding protein